MSTEKLSVDNLSTDRLSTNQFLVDPQLSNVENGESEILDRTRPTNSSRRSSATSTTLKVLKKVANFPEIIGENGEDEYVFDKQKVGFLTFEFFLNLNFSKFGEHVKKRRHCYWSQMIHQN